MKNALKKFLDSQIGDYGYIQVLRHDNVFLCEGKVKELRGCELWYLLDEENAKIQKSFLGESESGKRCITIVLSKASNIKAKNPVSNKGTCTIN